MNRMVKRLMVVLLSVFMFMGSVTTPVQAKDSTSGTNGWGTWWGWWWPVQPTEPDPEPAEEPVVEEEEPVETEEPVIEEEQEEETPVVEEETPVVEEAPAEEPVTEDAPAVEETPVAYPETNFEPEEVEGITVTVAAPEGALPVGTTIEVVPVSLDAVQTAVDKAAEITGTVVTAVDITFRDAQGEIIEPLIPITVTMTSEEIAKLDNPQVVHVDTNAEEIEDAEVEAEAVEAIAEEDAVVFDAEHFSVYAIITDPETGDETPYRTTYEFYNADGSKYYFKDAAGRDQYTQILKNGETLEDVGIPTAGASQNAKFVGWFDENGNKVEVGEAKTVTSNTTIKLTAKLQAIVNVFFVTAVMKDDQGQDMDRSIVTVKQVEYTIGQSEPITIDTSDVTTDAPTNEQAVVGWNRNESAANAGTAEGTNGVITLYENSNGEITDVMLFPAIQNAYWLYFNENDGGTGGGASYTPPQFVTIGGTPTKPSDPHRTGYEFGGWYKDAACTQAFDFNAVMTATTTVYAKWTGSATTYTIVVKVQSSSDSAKITSNQNLAHDAKSYDFWKAYTVNSTTGANATVADTYKQLANQIDSSGYITFETCDDAKTVAADGSTVMYVYYQRTVMTITWTRSTSQNGSVFATWYGLYGASFEESGKTWYEPDNGYWWRSSALLWTFKDSFKDFRPAGTTMRLYQQRVNSSWYDIYFYTENLDGSWKLDHQFDFTSGSFEFTEKYDAYSLYQYSRNNTSWYSARVGQSVNQNNQNLYIRYSRNSYNIEYHNGALGAEGTIVRTDSIKYETPLADHENPTVTYPVAADADHYDFVGWFADSGCKTMVTFTELDEKTKQNYRDWYGVVEFVTINKMPAHNFPLYAGYALKGWDCAINPNGGTLTNENQAGVFWLNYGEKFSSDLKTNITREGYVFQGWMLANVPKKDDGTLDLLNVTTDAANHRFVGDYSNWTMTDTPWEFSTGITGPTALMAKWFYKTAMSVVYDANGGSNPPVDEGSYSDHANTVAFRAPVAPENYVFIGWDIVGTDEEEKLQPGATFEVSSDYAVDGVVTLKAIYHQFKSEEEVPVTHITWYANNGTDESVTDDNLQINKAVNIRPADQFSYAGYKFIGWAKQSDATAASLFLKYDAEKGKFYAQATEGEGDWTEEVTQVAADEKKPYDDLYAIWEEQFFYVYHSSDQSVDTYSMAKDLTGGKFDITSKVKENFMYGGYYNDYAKKGSYKGDGKAVTDGKAYVGGLGFWTKSKAITANGRTMTPEADKTYYLKEVPNGFLASKVYVIYDAFNKETPNIVVDNYLITDVDDNNYSEISLFAEKIDTGNRIKLASSYTITDTLNGKTDKITAKHELFGMEAGYIAVWHPKLADKDYYILATYTTPDGVVVDGSKIRNVTIGNGTYTGSFIGGNGYKFVDTDNSSIITPGNISTR